MKNILSRTIPVLFSLFVFSTVGFSQGTFWGMTILGGGGDYGVIYKTDNSGNNFVVAKVISTDANGKEPAAELFEASNGLFYGILRRGGLNNGGTLFEFNPETNELTKKVDFNQVNGYIASHHMVEHPNGKIYGTLRMGGTHDNSGVLFSYDPLTGTFEKKIDFDANPVRLPQGLTLAPNGKFYGVAGNEDPSSWGSIYEYDPETNVVTRKIKFTSYSNGIDPTGYMTIGPNGNLYGLNTSGGASEKGTIFEYNYQTNTYTKRADVGADNAFPYGSLTLASNGKFYGLSTDGSTGNGTIFQFDPSTNTLTKKIDFDGSNGKHPIGGNLWQSPNGKLYGNTYYGGTADLGVLFEYDPQTNVVTKKMDFTGANGAHPSFNGLTFVKASQTVSFESLPSKTVGDESFALTATSSADLPVSFSSSNANVATIEGNIVTIVGVGSATITATAGNGYYKTASVSRELVVTEGSSEDQGIYVITPADQSINQSPALTIVAKEDPGALTYTIQLSTTSDFTLNVKTKKGGRTQKFSGLLFDKPYYARVKTNLSPVYGKVTVFKTAPADYFAYLISPADNAEGVYATVSLLANPVPRATSYTIHISTSADFSDQAYLGTGKRKQNVKLAYNTNFYARVKTNLTDVWGRTTMFTTGSPADLAFITAPGNNAINVGLNPMITVNAVPGATLYTIELNSSPDFSGTSIVKSSKMRSIQFNNLHFSTNYYVRAYTSSLVGVWGSSSTFRTRSESAARLAGHDNSNKPLIYKNAETLKVMSVYPNPVKNRFSIYVPAPVSELATVHFHDMQGKIVHTVRVETNREVELDIELLRGMYVVRALSTNTSAWIKVIKE
jgi:uncharacterized repeat protein (TIGR03803 family)